MKKAILIILGILISGVINGQENFTWVKVDTIHKSKSQIYSDTKLFIAEFWKSAQDVIQNDDKEAGIILIKGSTRVMGVNHSLNVFNYRYNYTVTFRMKENRYKITIDNVYCDKAYATNYEIQKIEPFDGEYVKGISPTLPEKKALKIMNELKLDLQSIIDNYQIEIKSNNSIDEDW